MKVTKELLTDFRKDFEEAVKGLEAKYHAKLELENFAYSPDNFEAKLTVKTTTKDLDKEKFLQVASYYGFTPEDYRGGILVEGKHYELIGFESRRPKFPCKLVSLDGDIMYARTAAVKQQLGKA